MIHNSSQRRVGSQHISFEIAAAIHINSNLSLHEKNEMSSSLKR